MRSVHLPLLLIFIFLGCQENKEKILRQKVEKYFAAWNRQDFESPDFALFKKDTSYIWHGTKEGNGSLSVFNSNSGWKQWDKAWNGTYAFEGIQIDIEEMMVSGQFNETTDFLKQIRMPEGFSATVTFWFDEDFSVKETLYDWEAENRSMHDQIKPLVEWAKLNDSITIQRIYLSEGFKPNTENALDWKKLLDAYSKAGGQFTQ